MSSSTPPKLHPVRNRGLRILAGRSPAPESSAHLLLRLALELVVVFVGVYAAFWLSEHQRQRDLAERRDQLQLALVQEIRDITNNTREVAEHLGPGLAMFDSLVAAGARPPIQPHLQPLRIESHMWNATLQSNGIDLLDVSTIAQLSQFYNDLNQSFEQWGQLRQLS